MSGHSKWSTIKRQKGANDAAKGKLFSKLGRAISIAVKSGGGIDPNNNAKLREVIDAARAVNMPKENIERAISRASSESENLEEVTYEGFGPKGIAIMLVAATDNRRRTGQEIKNIFERSGGTLGGPSSVSFNFSPRGYILVKKEGDTDKQMLTLIDLGVEDLEEVEDGIEAYVSPQNLYDVSQKIGKAGYKVEKNELIQKPLNLTTLDNVEDARKAVSFLESLEDHDDVHKVFANLDIPQKILEELASKT